MKELCDRYEEAEKLSLAEATALDPEAVKALSDWLENLYHGIASCRFHLIGWALDELGLICDIPSDVSAYADYVAWLPSNQSGHKKRWYFSTYDYDAEGNIVASIDPLEVLTER